ncbi:hypothetical protein FA95DRAFT_1612862 [Auriscalpium vulgare]|uniref:Uncharacterized protein n=1 Tax=Auriscalpium vulgare TaxID=40419 RepID=A0ACB8R5B5_9AGAM|nr:hypothetical protein FA95DRAFT_1612862 [Auriscalpium vulgare]
MQTTSTKATATVGSYYQRKREERKQYRRLHYEATKGRRKLSKAARESMVCKRRREQHGLRSLYHCSLSHSDPTDDPRRDADAESMLIDDVVALRDGLSNEPGEENWVPEFIRTVQTWIDKYVEEAQRIISEGIDTEGLRLHHLRRFVAGLRQEQYLAQQGRDARRAALEDLRLILLWGRRVNTVYFLKQYGW